MSWLKIDDGFFEHEKIEELSHAAFRLHVGGLCLCARLLTDGRVSESNLRKVATAGRISSVKKYVEELVAARLWSAHPRGGWKIKDYLDYNPSSVQVKEQRQRNAERQARHRVSNAVTNGVSNAAPSRPLLNTKNQDHLTPTDTHYVGDALEQIEALKAKIGREIR